MRNMRSMRYRTLRHVRSIRNMRSMRTMRNSRLFAFAHVHFLGFGFRVRIGEIGTVGRELDAHDIGALPFEHVVRPRIQPREHGIGVAVAGKEVGRAVADVEDHGHADSAPALELATTRALVVLVAARDHVQRVVRVPQTPQLLLDVAETSRRGHARRNKHDPEAGFPDVREQGAADRLHRQLVGLLEEIQQRLVNVKHNRQFGRATPQFPHLEGKVLFDPAHYVARVFGVVNESRHGRGLQLFLVVMVLVFAPPFLVFAPSFLIFTLPFSALFLLILLLLSSFFALLASFFLVLLLFLFLIPVSNLSSLLLLAILAILSILTIFAILSILASLTILTIFAILSILAILAQNSPVSSLLSFASVFSRRISETPVIVIAIIITVIIAVIVYWCIGDQSLFLRFFLFLLLLLFLVVLLFFLLIFLLLFSVLLFFFFFSIPLSTVTAGTTFCRFRRSISHTICAAFQRVAFAFRRVVC
jgi:hypothetical protein